MPSTLFSIENYIVNTAENTISSDDSTVKIEPKCIKVLKVLAEHAPEAVSREHMHKVVWGERIVVDEALSRVISQLRHALNDNKSKRLIKTIPKLGYKLTVTPFELSAAMSSSNNQLSNTPSANKSSLSTPTTQAAVNMNAETSGNTADQCLNQSLDQNPALNRNQNQKSATTPIEGSASLINEDANKVSSRDSNIGLSTDPSTGSAAGSTESIQKPESAANIESAPNSEKAEESSVKSGKSPRQSTRQSAHHSIQKSTLKKNQRFWLLAGVLVVAVIATAIIWLFTGSDNPLLDSTKQSSLESNSIAILPFSQISDDTDSSYISLGLTEEIISSLSTTPGFNVPSRYSTLALTKQGLSLADIATTLNVNYALEGSVRRINQSFRISVRLIAPFEDKALWTAQYDVTNNDLLKVQLEISNAIIAQVSSSHSSSKAPIKAGITDDAAAYQAYLKGTYWWMNGTTSEWFSKAEAAFLDAVNYDPAFSAAYGSLAYIYARYNFYDLYIPQEQALPKARAAIDNALRLNPNDANAHNATAILATLSFDFKKAAASLNRVLSEDADNATSLYLHSELALAQLSPDRALSFAQQAREIEPLSPWVNVNLAIVHYWRGETTQALAALDNALELDSAYTWAYVWKARVLALQGNNNDAIDVMEACLTIDPFSTINAAYLGTLYSVQGNANKANQWFTHTASLLGDTTTARFWKTHGDRLEREAISNTDIALMEPLLQKQTQAFSVIPMLTEGYIATQQESVGFDVIRAHFPSLNTVNPMVNSHNAEAALALLQLSSQSVPNISKALTAFIHAYPVWAKQTGFKDRFEKAVSD
ncbi:winged helix-turn-helix domain-containing protein [Alteromonas sp. LOR]|uniref:winged helix-turn-helix domain-containing protein n=1 Tax=Alteromonas sp. (strain LOR) TaxID=1537994 RepID=UPI0006898627|nr:winged helix-turn-helix domain-containing protein [Alteromonas sp. LOR]